MSHSDTHSVEEAGAAQTAEEHRVVDTVRTMLGLGGLLALVVGILILANPVKSGAAMMQIVAVIVSIYMIGSGAVYLGTSIFSKSLGGWARTGHILLGLLYLIAGVILMANLTATAVMLGLFLSIFIGVMWIFEGIMAFTTPTPGRSRVWSVIYGIISLIAGLVLIFVPLAGVVTLWLMIGISLIVLGALQIVRAFSVKAL